MNRKRPVTIKPIAAFLLSILLLFQTGTAFAATGTVSSNETAGEEELAITVSENGLCVKEEPGTGENPEEEEDTLEASKEDVSGLEEEEDTVSGQTLPEIQAGAVTGPANPVHHCTKKDDGSDYTDFSCIYFGSYPQSEVTDSAIIAAIDKAVSTSGTAADAGIDVWINGIKYRRIDRLDTTYDKYFDKVPNNGYRYFKWERIKWRVLKNDGKTLFVVADKALDCKKYNKLIESVRWETSSIRDWLNSSFYFTAFSNREQNHIAAQTVINENNPVYGTNGGNNTSDKICLLSIREVTDAAYGFCSDYGTDSMSREMKTSDYANARGVDVFAKEHGDSRYVGNCKWWLRSPGSDRYDAAHVYYWGAVSRTGSIVYSDYYGVCPALHINLSSALWSVTDDGTSGEGGEERIPVSLQVSKGKTTYCAGESLNTDDLKVTVSYQKHLAKTLEAGEYTTNASGINMNDPGKKTLTVSHTSGGVSCTASITITVNSIKKLSIKGPSKKLAAGKKVKLTLTTTPKGVSATAVKWKSSNKKYAAVDGTGTVNIKKAGAGKTVTITAAARGSGKAKAVYRFQIMKHAVKTIKLKAPRKTLKAGNSMTIKATVKTTGSNANKSLKWTSSNKKYATVNSKGKVTAKKAGKGKAVTITAKSTDGSNQKAVVQIKIK